MSTLRSILVATFKNWLSDKAPKMSAALAYYSCFALPPLLVIAIGIAGLIFEKQAAMGQVVSQLEGLIGKANAEAIQGILVRLGQLRAGVIGSVIGLAALVFGASGVFGELQDSLNIVWKVKKKPGRGLMGTLKDRFLSLTMVLGIGFLLLISLVLSAALSALSDWIGGGSSGILLKVAGVASGVLMAIFLFSLLFRFVPDATTRFRWTLLGGTVTALLFAGGRFALGAYLARSTIATSYGAAGAFLLILLWVYYSSQILFFGAELTTTLAAHFDRLPKPDADAVRDPAARPHAAVRH